MKIIAERAGQSVSGSGVGSVLMQACSFEEVGYYSLTEDERRIFNKTFRRFRRGLQAAGFLPALDRG